MSEVIGQGPPSRELTVPTQDQFLTVQYENIKNEATSSAKRTGATALLAGKYNPYFKGIVNGPEIIVVGKSEFSTTQVARLVTRESTVRSLTDASDITDQGTNDEQKGPFLLDETEMARLNNAAKGSDLAVNARARTTDRQLVDIPKDEISQIRKEYYAEVLANQQWKTFIAQGLLSDPAKSAELISRATSDDHSPINLRDSLTPADVEWFVQNIPLVTDGKTDCVLDIVTRVSDVVGKSANNVAKGKPEEYLASGLSLMHKIYGEKSVDNLLTSLGRKLH